MSPIRITDPADPRIADYRGVPDPELLRRGGLFVAENRLVVRTLLTSGRFRTRSVLVSDAAYEGMREQLAAVESVLPVFVCAKAMMQAISGYNIHRGCLALGERPAPVTVATLLAALPDARRLVVLEAIGNADNVGAVFRNARAFGANAVIAGPACCDPLCRKAIRVSIGASLVVPYTTSERPRAGASERQPAAPLHVEAPSGRPERAGSKAPQPHRDAFVGGNLAATDSTWMSDLLTIKAAGFMLVALTPAADALDLDDLVARGLPAKVALLAGHEGEGLSSTAQRAADARVRIAMDPGVDSLNVATATGIALYRTCR